MDLGSNPASGGSGGPETGDLESDDNQGPAKEQPNAADVLVGGSAAAGGSTGGTAGIGGGGTTPLVGGSGGGSASAPIQGGAAGAQGGTGGVGGTGGGFGGTGGVRGPIVMLPSLPMPQGGASGTPQPPMPGSNRPAGFDFEQDEQGWIDLKSQGSRVARTTARAATGSASLEALIDTKGKSGEDLHRYIGLPRNLVPTLRPGQQVNFRVWVPADSKLFGVQPFVVTSAGRWQGSFRFIDSLNKGNWTDISVTLPNDFDTSMPEWLGVQILTQEGGWKGSVFIDSVLF